MSKHWDPRQGGRSGEWGRYSGAVRPHREPRRRLPDWQLNVLMLLAVYAAAALYGLGNPLASDTTITSGGGGEAASPAAVRVIDGDTFDHDGTRIRIADIDTPETDGRCAYETDLATRATRRLEALLAAGPFELHQAPDGRDEDRYGRKLRIVTRGGRSIGDMLVAEGLARTWTGRREPWCL